MSVRVQHQVFDLALEQAALHQADPAVGALVSFVGYVRDVHENVGVEGMLLEHYPGMTETALQAIVDEARSRWPLLRVSVIHRVGQLLPADPIVFVGVVSPHRAAAFAACEFIMDYLKTRAPFWKKETTASGTRWVEARETDDAAAARWEIKA